MLGDALDDDILPLHLSPAEKDARDLRSVPLNPCPGRKHPADLKRGPIVVKVDDVADEVVAVLHGVDEGRFR